MKIITPLFCVSLSLAYLLPAHYLPWSSFLSEFLAFFSIVLLLPLLFLRRNIAIPRFILPFLLLSAVPLLQYYFTQIFFFTIAWLASLYLFTFMLAVIVGYNLTIKEHTKNSLLNAVYIAFFVASLFSSCLAIFQWLGVFKGQPWIMGFTGNRPYANIGQFNQLSTLLSLGLLSGLYFFERAILKRNIFIISSCLFLFAMALSQSRTGWLIITFCFIFVMVWQNKMDLKSNYKDFIFLTLFYILAILVLPSLNHLLAPYFDIAPISSASERISSGYLRLDIWNQMIHAVMKQPLWGYGWNQTSVAQAQVIDVYKGYEWASSAHNLFLDIIVWCGLPLGSIVVLYILWIYKNLFNHIVNLETLIIFLIVSALGIHSMLEFPLYYMYFLLPLGLLIGISFRYQSRSELLISRWFIPIIVSFSFFAGYHVYQQYNLVWDNTLAGKTAEMNDHKGKVDLPYTLFLFDQYDARAQWIGLNVHQKMTAFDWVNAKKMAELYIMPYDLIKYAQVLAVNGQEQEAKRQLAILNYTYRRNLTYEQLFDK
ncbi:PglL family O-oligosaccharyltransferase [Acinetobacter rathckeae]|uniref:PglL family O-oligosaccharyltransferase n=1 Tax=Acinetobacter rathckeae TaxID=2605272 RepID=UPI0018A2ACCB|nr:O-antigen ligase family protein [Acinetobacter rathckeae]MBF7696111.1 O-antigen ligase C-terminal domain-containing protein [Acinetobacter rathckeae]